MRASVRVQRVRHRRTCSHVEGDIWELHYVVSLDPDWLVVVHARTPEPLP